MKVFFTCLCIIQSVNLYAQFENGSDQKKFKSGISLGLNYSNILYEEFSPPINVAINASNGMGFRIGIVTDYQISKVISIAPKAELSLNSGQVSVQNVNGNIIGGKTIYDILPVSIDIMAHLVFEKGTKNWKPYFFIGPNVRLPLLEKNTNQTVENSSDIAIDIGVGGQRTFTHFHFLPELRYTFGLLDLNRDPRLQSVNFHSISLVFSIMG
jgi:outer membrane protein W